MASLKPLRNHEPFALGPLGIEPPQTVQALQELNNVHSPSIIFLMETRKKQRFFFFFFFLKSVRRRMRFTGGLLHINIIILQYNYLILIILK